MITDKQYYVISEIGGQQLYKTYFEKEGNMFRVVIKLWKPNKGFINLKGSVGYLAEISWEGWPISEKEAMDFTRSIPPSWLKRAILGKDNFKLI